MRKDAGSRIESGMTKEFGVNLVIDVGNTTLSVGKVSKTKVLDAKSFNYMEFPNKLPKWIESGRFNPKKASICSVNPTINVKLKKIISNSFPECKIQIINNKSIPISNNYSNLDKLGVDRTVNVYSAGNLYGWPCLVIDLGTAVSFDLGGPKKSFDGGLIFPGRELAFRALQDGAAKLSRFPLKFPKNPKIIGKNTEDCVNYGISYGYGVMIRDMIKEYQELARSRWKKKLRVIITGGGYEFIKPFLRKVDKKYDKHLTLKGLALLQQNKLK